VYDYSAFYLVCSVSGKANCRILLGMLDSCVFIFNLGLLFAADEVWSSVIA